MAEVPDFSSPCNRVCTLDLATDICIGCFRTLDEISGWTRFTNAEREAIRAALPRREQDFKEKRNRG
jgi:predicted Fe-S protein YdhL (DUF1289 family)